MYDTNHEAELELTEEAFQTRQVLADHQLLNDIDFEEAKAKKAAADLDAYFSFADDRAEYAASTMSGIQAF